MAHIEKKHPGFWKNIQPILDNGRLLGEEEGAIEYADKLHFTDGEALVVITRYWAKDKSTGAWVITAFEPTTGKKYLDRLEKKLLEEIKQRKEALERNSRLHQVTNYRQMGLPPNERGDSLSQQSKGDYFPNLRTIVRWATADQSTLLHETGHWFVEARIGVARDLEQKPNLTSGEQHYLDATLAALKWLGVDSIAQWDAMTFEQRRPLHEKFACTYEAYLMSGQAPTRGLRKVFRQFSNFLKKIYFVIAAIPEAELNSQTKELFDRLFISENQIEEAKLRRQMYDLMEFVPDLAEDSALAEYESLIEERDDIAVEYLQSRLIKDFGADQRRKGARPFR